MAATQIKRVAHPHDAILDELLAHPWQTLFELSQKTGYGVSWLSVIIRSDCFQAEYHRRRGQIEVNVMGSVQDRLQALSHLAIDRMETVLAETIDNEEVIDAFDKVLHRTGYAPKAQGPAPSVVAQQQNNYFLVQKDELAELRGRIVNQQPEQVLLPPAENDE